MGRFHKTPLPKIKAAVRGVLVRSNQLFPIKSLHIFSVLISLRENAETTESKSILKAYNKGSI